jgi:hypothetical protein
MRLSLGINVSDRMMSRHKKKHPMLPPSKKLRLKDNHTWDAPKGYKIVVADRGAVSFNIPASWVVAKLEPHLELNDKAPPDDDARLSMSFWRTPPGVDWTGLPLAPLLLKSSEDSKMEILERSELIRSSRTDIELVWVEHKFMDPKEHREAFTRLAMARGFDVHVLITCDFWVTDSRRIRPVWEEALRSLQLGRHIEDPTKGETLH